MTLRYTHQAEPTIAQLKDSKNTSPFLNHMFTKWKISINAKKNSEDFILKQIHFRHPRNKSGKPTRFYSVKYQGIHIDRKLNS